MAKKSIGKKATPKMPMPKMPMIGKMPMGKKDMPSPFDMRTGVDVGKGPKTIPVVKKPTQKKK